jgi:hypothetical protein
VKHIGIPVPQNKNKTRKLEKKEKGNDLGDGKSTPKEQSKRSDVLMSAIEKLSSIDTCVLIELRGKMSLEDETIKEHAISQNSTVNYGDLST